MREGRLTTQTKCTHCTNQWAIHPFLLIHCYQSDMNVGWAVGSLCFLLTNLSSCSFHDTVLSCSNKPKQGRKESVKMDYVHFTLQDERPDNGNRESGETSFSTEERESSFNASVWNREVVQRWANSQWAHERICFNSSSCICSHTGWRGFVNVRGTAGTLTAHISQCRKSNLVHINISSTLTSVWYFKTK